MAPSATETVTTQDGPALLKLHSTQAGTADYKQLQSHDVDLDAEAGKKGFEAARYANYLPTWNPSQRYPPLTPFEHTEHGKDADPSLKDLLLPGSEVVDLTPSTGSEVYGVQLSKLSDAGKDQLALYVAQRKVVAFRGQDLADHDIKDALAWGGYFGRHHIHPTSGSPAGHPEVHLVHRAAGDRDAAVFFATRTSSVAWHSDVSYEAQPPGTTFLYVLDQPETGGDTLFVNAVEAYRRLSPLMQERLHGLTAVHSGIEQVNAAKAAGSIARREPVFHAHPIIRTHPATGEKAIWRAVTREIVGMKKEESDMLLKFLYYHLAYGADFQARVKWQEGTVVVWDNRVTQHSALIDWQNGQRRHLARITPQAEPPFETPFQA